ncbi:Cu(I)-responsive transcriptional regulator [Vibrio gazogenes]|uniref:HTH-type transcriptional regulator CueR n=2 Tax=Vibrio TaxID=662 RepID=A0A1M5DJQ1_VIBGA|nr:Cu(I)-responsive transcriptional regulator [Vibrio gazogenes]USP14600.1 Cu(I)-responsive transcriptional regulator [Vibrio gazogenes]SHF67131.1 MerR family transcriptional regulator, copper efflux regulator [Vibrio gazogenes DSM 21264] [Vibrio gazogenes DSM 21264 = NBRC 103151]SJN59233.1 HTH-type transcriptional regulator CueR [Vibrio gazogenes]
MNISEVSKLTGLTAKSIRLYEEKGILSPPLRGENGYRVYQQSHIDDLLLIARAKRVGFNLEECKLLVHLANDPSRKSCAVKAEARKKLTQVTRKLNELQLIQSQLEQWIAECPGDDNSDCPIIDDLKGQSSHREP